MSQEQEEDFEFFLSYKERVQNLKSNKQDLISLYMCSRLAVFTLDSKEVSLEDIVQSEKLIKEQLEDPSEQRAELVANYAQENAEAVKDDGRQRWIHIGYWSCVCYWFMFSKTRESKFTEYVYVAFFDGLDDYFMEDNPKKYLQEEANFLSAYQNIQAGKLDDITSFIEWAKSAGPGEKLSDFVA